MSELKHYIQSLAESKLRRPEAAFQDDSDKEDNLCTIQLIENAILSGHSRTNFILPAEPPSHTVVWLREQGFTVRRYQNTGQRSLTSVSW